MPADFDAIPLIDITALRTGTPSDRRRCVERLGEAARDVGFLYLGGHGLRAALFADLAAAAQRFFALPLAEKMRVYIGRSKNHRGYVPEGEEVFAGGSKDRKE